jgi:hypothetical protein
MRETLSESRHHAKVDPCPDYATLVERLPSVRTALQLRSATRDVEME